jgi:hypothetical protein
MNFGDPEFLSLFSEDLSPSAECGRGGYGAQRKPNPYFIRERMSDSRHGINGGSDRESLIEAVKNP